MNFQQSIRVYSPWWRVGVMMAVIAGDSTALMAEFFLVTEYDAPFNCYHCDSYVIEITDPGMVEHARLLVMDPNPVSARIVLADVIAGRDGINGDYIEPGFRLWSWHAAFNGFAEMTIELCDGWPTGVENDVPYWEGIGICFWGYTITRELSPDELICVPGDVYAVPLTPESVRLTWTDRCPGEDFYVIERRPWHGADQWHQLAELPAGSSSYTDTDAIQGFVQYSYRVGAGFYD